MAPTVKSLVAGAVFYASIALWSINGFILLLRTIYKFPNLLFKKIDHSEIPECATDPTLGEHGTVTVSATNSSTSTRQLKVKYVANGKSGLPLMLCVHGFPECWYSWRYQLKEFSNKYRVVAIDLPGYGDSDKPDGEEHYKVRALVDVIASVISQLGYEQATVVGHDWGGALVWNFALIYGDMCKKVVVMNAPNTVGFKKGFTFKQYCMSWYMFFFQLPWIPEFVLGLCDFAFLSECFCGQWGVTNKHNMTKEDIEVYKYALHSWEARKCAINYYRANSLLSRDVSSFNARNFTLSCPVLLIWGTEDKALSLGLAAKSASASELITLEFVEGASHWVQQDDPTEVNKLMWEFLN